MHLDEDTYRRLIDATLPGPEARVLAAHLDSPCEACEAFLAGRAQVDSLDGRVDGLLMSIGLGPSEAQRDDLAYARVERTLRTRPPDGATEVAPSLRRWITGLAAAAVLVAAGLAGLLRAPAPQGPSWDGEKGGAGQAIPLRLRFLVVVPGEGGPPALERGLSGQEVPASASLQFQVELGRPAHVLLAHAGSSGGPEVFFSTRLEAGRHVVSLGGQPAVYPLATLAGPQRFLALASEAPLGPEDAARAALPGSGARRDDGPPISLDQVEVRVRP